MRPELRIIVACTVLVLVAAPGRAAGLDELVGTWTWTWKDAQGETHKHVLEVEGSGDKVAARERFDEMEPVKVTDLKLVDKKVSFTVKRGERRSSYSGTVKEKDAIDGVVTVSSDGQPGEFGWSAKREPAKK